LGMISAQMYRAVQLNFQTEGARTPGGKWIPLSPVTIALRRKGKGSGSPRILQDTGYLKNSIIPTYDENQAVVGTNLSYAGIHQYGIGRHQVQIPATTRKDGVAVKAHTKSAPPIPARPFMVLNDSDKEKIYRIAVRVIKGDI